MTDQHTAQTNLQLYNQLVELSWSQDDLTRARAAYEFADELFRELHRGNGKPFVAHLVGTASVAAEVDGRPPLVLAALLHAVYTGGGTAITSAAPPRTIVRSVVGTDAEALIFAYATSAWGPDAFADAIANAHEFDGVRREVLLMRLANEVDERIDLGTRYGDKGQFLRDRDDVLTTMASLADRIECPKLAAAFRRLFDEQHGVEVPSVLRASTRTSPVRVSDSHAARFSRSLRAAAQRARRRLVSVPGARSAVHALRRVRPSSRAALRQ